MPSVRFLALGAAIGCLVEILETGVWQLTHFVAILAELYANNHVASQWNIEVGVEIVALQFTLQEDVHVAETWSHPFYVLIVTLGYLDIPCCIEHDHVATLGSLYILDNDVTNLHEIVHLEVEQAHGVFAVFLLIHAHLDVVHRHVRSHHVNHERAGVILCHHLHRAERCCY